MLLLRVRSHSKEERETGMKWLSPITRFPGKSRVADTARQLHASLGRKVPLLAFYKRSGADLEGAAIVSTPLQLVTTCLERWRGST